MIRPVARLNFKIREEELDDELVTDIKRCFLNVAPVLIEGVEDTEEKPAVDTLQLVVTLHSPYWHKGEEADETWSSTLLPWLDKKLYKLGATVANYNKTRADKGQPVYYRFLEISMGEHTFSFELPEDSEFPKEAPSLIDRCRDLAHTGALEGLEFIRVDMPWQDPERFGALEASDATEDSNLRADTEGEPVSDDVETENTEISTKQDNACDEPASPEPVDYTVWEVHFSDGSSRRLDMGEGTWIE